MHELWKLDFVEANNLLYLCVKVGNRHGHAGPVASPTSGWVTVTEAAVAKERAVKLKKKSKNSKKCIFSIDWSPNLATVTVTLEVVVLPPAAGPVTVGGRLPTYRDIQAREAPAKACPQKLLDFGLKNPIFCRRRALKNPISWGQAMVRIWAALIEQLLSSELAADDMGAFEISETVIAGSGPNKYKRTFDQAGFQSPYIGQGSYFLMASKNTIFTCFLGFSPPYRGYSADLNVFTTPSAVRKAIQSVAHGMSAKRPYGLGTSAVLGLKNPIRGQGFQDLTLKNPNFGQGNREFLPSKILNFGQALAGASQALRL
ncbi:hypothetical protein DFH06DRAFT_1151881 [Mycena polygramma]|nr:hypothetical protein DFH06DRAFT_1151881 [Mycena polygramma]